MSDISDKTQGRLRILVLGAIIMSLVLIARLWLLQGVWGQEYKKQAEENRIRRLAENAPRGEILDTNGVSLVKNRLSVVLSVEAERIGDKEMMRRLSEILDMSVSDINEQARGKNADPIAPRIIKKDVSSEAIAYIEENKNDFAGVELRAEPLRDYPYESLAAHILGYMGELSEDEIKQSDFKEYALGDIVGKSGLERQYEDILSGSKGTRFVEVNAAGRLLKVIDRKDPDPGNNIVLSLDKEIQMSAEAALYNGIQRTKKLKFPRASGGAVVVMKPNGAIVAMASYPTFDPRQFIGGISTSQWAEMTDEKSEYPLNNRAIMSGYPPASVFKVVTAVAGLKTGVMTVGTVVNCRGKWTGLGKRWAKWCWDRAGHGRQSLEGALRVSCDSFFYEIGHRLYKSGGENLQKWALQLGLGSKTGIDLPSEAEGRVPTAAWKKEWNKDWPQNQTWFPGDTVNMAIGQGDLLVTPIQMANIYAAIANGGVLYRPHIVKAVVGLDGRTIFEVPDKKIGELGLAGSDLAAMRRGLRRVIIDGTAKGAFSGFPIPVSGKTGTAEVMGKDDYAVFAAYAPSDDPQYVIALIIEQGGHGGSAAAPVAREIFSDIFDVKESTRSVGTSR